MAGRCVLFTIDLSVIILASAILGGNSVVAQSPRATQNGDINGSGTVDLSDAVYLLTYLFLGGPPPVPLECGDLSPKVREGDTNGDGEVDVSDGIHLLNWLFVGGGAPVAACAQVYPLDSSPFGVAYANWTAKWWTWESLIPASVNPLLVDSCQIGQSGEVWFFAGGTQPTVFRSCTIPFGKSILYPLSAYLNDFPCPDPNFKPGPGQSLQDFLTQGARALMDNVIGLECEVDMTPIEDLLGYRVTTSIFTFTGDPSLIPVLDPCITGSPQKAVSDGYWIMLPPLPLGVHHLHSRVIWNNQPPAEVFATLTIVP